ncbi:MAG: hypothetical protein ACOCZH_00205 [Phototrophicaceae bacterium]
MKSRRLSGALNLVLDGLAPLGPVGAQLLYVLQPLAGVFGWRAAVGQLARTLEEPDGIARLRRQLDASDQSPDQPHDG